MDEVKHRTIIKMKSLIKRLNAASDAYYKGIPETMSNYEWDAAYDKLMKLEKETGIIYPDSPTHNVSYSSGEKMEEAHEVPALSLAKTKSIYEFVKWANGKDVWLMWKLDGITLVVTYDDGYLSKVVTRGTGKVGTNITWMAPYIYGIPSRINHNGHLVIRGEAVIAYSDFEILNQNKNYMNPRNLVAGTLGMKPGKESVEKLRARHVRFIPFRLVISENVNDNSFGKRLDFLDELGFSSVQRELCRPEDLDDAISRWTSESERYDIPVDGLVEAYDDVAYASEGESTNHHEKRGGFALKWQDESARTVLRNIEWSVGPTCITPIAIFDPVRIEGSTISRASLYNLSEIERLGIGGLNQTELLVIKANMIIPKIVRVISSKGSLSIPSTCPECDSKIYIHDTGTSKVMKCLNEECPAKILKRLERFVSREGMNIKGLSEKYLKKFIDAGYIHDVVDVYNLHLFRDELIKMDGFSAKRVDNILRSIEKSKINVSPVNLLVSLGIPLIGRSAAMAIFAEYEDAFVDEFIMDLINGRDFSYLDDIGPVANSELYNWFRNSENEWMFRKLLKILFIRDC